MRFTQRPFPHPWVGETVFLSPPVTSREFAPSPVSREGKACELDLSLGGHRWQRPTKPVAGVQTVGSDANARAK